MTRNLSVWNSLRPFSVGFDSIFEEFDRMLESTERYSSNYPPYNIHKLNEKDYKIETRLTYTPFDGGKGWIIVIKALK